MHSRDHTQSLFELFSASPTTKLKDEVLPYYTINRILLLLSVLLYYYTTTGVCYFDFFRYTRHRRVPLRVTGTARERATWDGSAIQLTSAVRGCAARQDTTHTQEDRRRQLHGKSQSRYSWGSRIIPSPHLCNVLIILLLYDTVPGTAGAIFFCPMYTKNSSLISKQHSNN